MGKHWWFWIPVIALALYGSSNDFNLSAEWFPWAVGLTLFAPFAVLPILPRMGLMSANSPARRARDWFVIYLISVVASGLIVGSALPALGTTLFGNEERVMVTASAREKISHARRSLFDDHYYQLQFVTSDGVFGKHSLDEETFRQLEGRGGGAIALIRRSWFGFELLEIEGSGNSPSAMPKLTL